MATAMTVSSTPTPDGERAFEAYYADHVADVRRVVRRYLWGSVVDDVVQETFAQAYRSQLHLEPQSPRAVKTLWGVARNRSIDVLRRRMRGAEELGDDGRLVTVAATSRDGDPETVLLASRRRDGIAEALDSLCERQRRILFMHYVDGRRYEEIAAEEGITVDAVKAALARGRRTFRDLYVTIADREGLAVVLGGLMGRMRSWLRGARTRMAAGVENMAGGVTAASPAVANAFVAVVVAGSLSLAAGSTAAAAQGGPPEEPPPSQAQDESAEGEGTPPESPPDEQQAPKEKKNDDAPPPGKAKAESKPQSQGEGKGQGSGSTESSPGKKKAKAEADTGEVAPTKWSKGDGKAAAEAEADTENRTMSGHVDAVADATLDTAHAGADTAAGADTSVCPEETAPTTGDLSRDAPSQYYCPAVPH